MLPETAAVGLRPFFGQKMCYCLKASPLLAGFSVWTGQQRRWSGQDQKYEQSASKACASRIVSSSPCMTSFSLIHFWQFLFWPIQALYRHSGKLILRRAEMLVSPSPAAVSNKVCFWTGRGAGFDKPSNGVFGSRMPWCSPAQQPFAQIVCFLAGGDAGVAKLSLRVSSNCQRTRSESVQVMSSGQTATRGRSWPRFQKNG